MTTIEKFNDSVMHTYGRYDLVMESGSGREAVDENNKKYIDFGSGIGTNSLGYCDEEWADAVCKQVRSIQHTSNYYYTAVQAEFANKLCKTTGYDKVFFGNSGAEANECAIKIARKYSFDKYGKGRSTIITLVNSFHGRTMATLSATGQDVFHNYFFPFLEGFVHTPANDIEALEQTFVEMGDEICGMLIEPVQGECGVYPCTGEYLKAARRLTKEYGAVLMFDEVQCGMYRCGTPFAFQQNDVMPDIVTMAKGIAGGVPMGACAARTSVAKVFEPGIHGSTFGGSCLAITAANTVLDTIAAEGIADNVTKVGAYFRERLAELSQVVEVRGMGLMAAVDLADDIDANAVVLAGLEAGLVFNATGPHTLRFLPPLVCAQSDVDSLIARLSELL